MKTKKLYYIAFFTLLFDVASCHLMLIEKILYPGWAYYMYCIAQAITMYSLYYRISLQLEKPELFLVKDKYTTGIAFYYSTIVPFAFKQIVDEMFFPSGKIDWLDYPLLFISLIIAHRKYYIKNS